MPDSKRTTTGSFLIFGFAIIITLLFWAVLPASMQANESSDYVAFYEPVARNLLAGRGFVVADEALSTTYPPGFSTYLAALFRLSQVLNLSEKVVLDVATLVCVAVTAVVIFRIASTIWGPTWGLVSGALWSLYPPMLWLTKQPNSEIPFNLIFIGCFALWWQAQRQQQAKALNYFVIGGLCGISMLIRPNALAVGLLFGLLTWLMRQDVNGRRRAVFVGAILLGNFVTVLPWEGLAYAQTGQVILLSSNGAPSIWDGLTFGINSKGWRTGVWLPEDVVALSNTFFDQHAEIKTISNAATMVFAEIKTEPAAVLKLYAIKALRSWYATDSQRQEGLNMLVQAAFLLPALWGSSLAWQKNRQAKQMVTAVWLFILYFWGMTIIALSILRYMVPVMSLLFLFMPGPIIWWIRRTKYKQIAAIQIIDPQFNSAESVERLG